MAQRVVVVGAVAIGPKAASRIKRLMPDAQVTLIDQSTRISYGGCGIPYFVSGEVARVEDLQSTPNGALRDPNFFKIRKDIDVLTQTKAIKIDRQAKKVTVENVVTGEKKDLPYDKLVIGVGSSPNRLPIPGIELEGISAATNLDEADYIKKEVASGRVNKAVVVGGGFIGLEMAVAFGDMWGIPTSVVEIAPTILPNFLSSTLAQFCAHDLETHNVQVYNQEKVVRFEGENGRVKKVITDKREIEADLVVMAAGVRPNTDIAKEAGLELNERGLILVDESLRSSDPDIYAGGDCVSIKNLITGKMAWFPLGSMANRQGRVIGTNVAGGNAKFPGAIGAWGVKLFDLHAAGAGFTIEVAQREGFDAVNVHVQQVDKAHFYPGKTVMALELVVEKSTKRVLGIQGVCANGDSLAARINPVAALLTHGKVYVEDISNLEVLYSPPFASAMDVINAAGNVADNILSGSCKPMGPEEFAKEWANRDANHMYVLDVRIPRDAENYLKKYPKNWFNILPNEVTKHLADLPKDKDVIIMCNSGLISYEAELNLAKAGFKNARTLLGGISGVKMFGVDI